MVRVLPSLNRDSLSSCTPPLVTQSAVVFSRVGDRPTATILHAQFHLFDFCLGFYGKVFDQNMPLLEGPITPQNGGAVKPPLQFTLYLPLLRGAYFDRIFPFKNRSKNQKNEIVHAEL